jgi:predicted permease
MKRLRAFVCRLAGLVPNARREQELADEIESHLHMHIDDNLRRGMTPNEARRDALLKLGGVQSTRQMYREQRTLPAIEHLLQDLRFAIRQLRKSPGFTLTAVFMLALGLCASVAIFGFVDAALIKPLPYRDPNRLVGVFESIALFPQSNLSYPDYVDWKKRNHVFHSLDVYEAISYLLTTPTGAEPAQGARVSDGFFRTLGVTPVLGRDFYQGEDSPGAQRTALLSYMAWQKRYGGRRDALGKTVTLDGAPNVIIGVLPPDFHFAPVEPAEFWTSLHPSGYCDERRGCHDLYGVARLEDGVSIRAALADVKVIAAQLEKQYPDTNRGQGAAVAPLSDSVVGSIRPILILLLGGAGLLLLIATVNVASLLLVRSESRNREIALRTALGARKARLMSQFATEGLALVLAGGAVGLAAAHWTMQLLTRLIPPDRLGAMPFLYDVRLNGHALAFAGVIGLVAAVLFALTPALHLSLSEMRQGLTEGNRGSAGNTWRRLGSRLVVVELATAMVLLAGAGLLGKSLYRLLRVDIGFQPDHLVTLKVGAPDATYGKDEQAIALEHLLLSRISTLPGVRSVGVSQLGLPMDGNGNTTWLWVLGRPWHGERYEAPQRNVSTGYFRTLGAKLVRGRYFTEADQPSKPPVAIVNQALARQYFPGEDALGKHLSHSAPPGKPIEIVGIVEDIKEGPVDATTPAVLYVPFDQYPGNNFGLVVRTSQAEQAQLPTLAATIRRIDRGIVTYQGATMSERVSRSTYLHQSSAWLVGGFAALALLLGVVGLYGVVAYSVSQRTREIGVRMALGAQPRAVCKLILKEAGWLTVAGTIVGLVCSLAAATLMRGLLFGVDAWDLQTLAAVAAVLAGSALVASYIPARRAASVSPIEALRAE